MDYYAHIYIDSDGVQHQQTVGEHCRACAEYAAKAAPPGFDKTAYLAGLLHDMGKCSDEFQTYIDPDSGTHAPRGSVNHTFAGTRYALEQWHADLARPDWCATSELIAFAVGSHHGQFDCVSPEGVDGYLHRLTKEGTGYAQAKDRYCTCCAKPQELQQLFEDSVREMAAVLETVRRISCDQQQAFFYFGLLARHILAAVIEGDRRDTAEFMSLCQIEPSVETSPALWLERLCHVEERIAAFPTDSPVNAARRQISESCRSTAKRESGIYRLTVPTGGGKTLAALRFSLAHAAEHRKKRLIFVTPLLSVLEQNAAVLHRFIGDDRLILEHHSNVVREESKDGALDEAELLCENWGAPIIITTLVQLLNTLFLGKSSCIRRMTALNGSVIVIDEVQSVPRSMLSEFNLAMNYLALLCGATVILCSATQPCLEKAVNPLRFAPQPELVPYDADLWEVFRRVTVTDRRRDGGYTTDELADLACECAESEGNLLLVCNTKSEARSLFRALKQRRSTPVYHLSTAMCMQHRKAVLRAITEALEHEGNIICVSTQLVEAGVDFSFACVIRVSAGIDNIIQAAGRCNRSGEYGRLCPAYIVNLREENLSRLKEIRAAQRAAESLLLRYKRDPAAYGNDLSGERAIRGFYSDLYADMVRGAQDYPLPQYSSTLYDLLSSNQIARHHCRTADSYLIPQAFGTAGKAFKVFDDSSVDVLVPYGEGNKLLTELCSEKAKHDLAYRMVCLKKAAPYCITLYEYELKRLEKCGGIYPICENSVLALQPDYYSGDTGYSPEGDNTLFLEVHNGP